jgi:5-methylcytosine-specific restriction endonuclease McrA
MPDDYPTIDHLISAFMGPRENVDGKVRTLVLACPQCNNARNVAEAKQHIWRTRWKSGSFPSPLRWFGKLLKKYRARKP